MHVTEFQTDLLLCPHINFMLLQLRAVISAEKPYLVQLSVVESSMSVFQLP